ncbi:hypothetical protein CRUP_012565 [Coryphaenoides rupestris]|nr:hypothetical protein CRUP_012565 [Coryphaenoides rupestris]
MSSIPAVSLSEARRVAVFGGTHGNELSGVTLVNLWARDAGEIQRRGVHTRAFIANPRAVERCSRYVDTDLNRAFTAENLRRRKKKVLYVQRAQEINRMFGPKGSAEAYDKAIAPASCPVLLNEDPRLKYATVRSVAKHSVGVLRSNIFESMRIILKHALDFIELFNEGVEFPPCTVDVFKVAERMDYPRDANGNIIAMVHPNLQTFDGQTIPYEGVGAVYPTFVNEAAYYEKQQAFVTTRREAIAANAIRKA